MNSINLIEKAQELSTHLEAILRNNPQLPPKPREFVQETITQLASLAERLRSISETCVDLTDIKTGEREMLKNVDFWNEIPAGQIVGPTLTELVMSHSMTLKTLYQGAIDIRQISKFDESQLSMARELGDNFSIHQHGWSGLKAALAKRDNGAHCKAADAHEVKRFLTMLQHRKVITGFRFLSAKFQGKTRTWTETSPAALRHLPENHPCLFEFDGFDRSHQPFLTGHWFNAYAYTVFEDQLKRLDSDYEIYPRVEFEHATGGRRTKGDFDVIINIGRRLLLVECKSGRIDREHGRDDFVEIVEKTDMLKKAFSSTRIADHTFLLLFNPEANDPQAIRDYFASRSIEAVTPAEIRIVVMDKIRDVGTPA